jgi:hypothetical protein
MAKRDTQRPVQAAEPEVPTAKQVVEALMQCMDLKAPDEVLARLVKLLGEGVLRVPAKAFLELTLKDLFDLAIEQDKKE